MGLILGIGVIVAIAVAIAVLLRTGVWLLFTVALPLAWLWMLIDAILRRDAEYPSRDTAEKIVWIVLVVLLPPSAIAYYLLVYRKQKLEGASHVAPAVPSLPPDAGVGAAPQG